MRSVSIVMTFVRTWFSGATYRKYPINALTNSNKPLIPSLLILSGALGLHNLCFPLLSFAPPCNLCPSGSGLNGCVSVFSSSSLGGVGWTVRFHFFLCVCIDVVLLSSSCTCFLWCATKSSNSRSCSSRHRCSSWYLYAPRKRFKIPRMKRKKSVIT